MHAHILKHANIYAASECCQPSAWMRTSTHTNANAHAHTHTLPVVSAIHRVSRPAFAMTCVGDLLKHGNAEVCAGKYLFIYLLSESENLIN